MSATIAVLGDAQALFNQKLSYKCPRHMEYLQCCNSCYQNRPYHVFFVTIFTIDSAYGCKTSATHQPTSFYLSKNLLSRGVCSAVCLAVTSGRHGNHGRDPTFTPRHPKLSPLSVWTGMIRTPLFPHEKKAVNECMPFRFLYLMNWVIER